MLREQWRSGARSRLDEVAASLAERSRRHGELAYLLEGDLKEARGGLRDVVVLHALVASWLADSPHGEIDHATTTLLDVRDALHAVTGRAGERLLLAEQDAVAVALGVPDADALLTKVASAARTVSHSLDLTLRRARGATTRRRGLRRQKPRLRPLEPGLVEHEGEVVLSSAAAPVSDPTIAVRAAAAAAVHGLPLSPVTASHLASTSVPLPTPWPTQATEALVRLLGAGEPLVGVWETLDQAGLATTWFPEWAGVRNRPQRTAVHRHTVDRHLVQTCVEATALLDRVSRPDLLLVCALLHDIGKLPGAMDHSSVGAPVAHRVATRLGLGAADAGGGRADGARAPDAGRAGHPARPRRPADRGRARRRGRRPRGPARPAARADRGRRPGGGPGRVDALAPPPGRRPGRPRPRRPARRRAHRAEPAHRRRGGAGRAPCAPTASRGSR